MPAPMLALVPEKRSRNLGIITRRIDDGNESPVMMTFDLHIHTSRFSPDSVMDPFEMLERARELRLDGLVITEHDAVWPEEHLRELREVAPDLVILSGVEVSGRQGHMLVYGVSDLTGLGPGVDWGELVYEVHRRGGAAVAAHPNRFGQYFDEELEESGAELDGVEVMSNNMDDGLRERAKPIVAAHPHFATLGNSDAHRVEDLAVCVTDFDAEVRSDADLVAAIRARKATPRVHAQRR